LLHDGFGGEGGYASDRAERCLGPCARGFGGQTALRGRAEQCAIGRPGGGAKPGRPQVPACMENDGHLCEENTVKAKLSNYTHPIHNVYIYRLWVCGSASCVVIRGLRNEVAIALFIRCETFIYPYRTFLIL